MRPPRRQLLAVGDDQGTVHVMDVPRNLRRMASELAATSSGSRMRTPSSVSGLPSSRSVETARRVFSAADGSSLSSSAVISTLMFAFRLKENSLSPPDSSSSSSVCSHSDEEAFSQSTERR